MSSTRYSCESCDWYYKKGSGMGTGSGNAGKHPRNTGPSSGQATLTVTGEWCHECKTCAKPGYCRCVEADDETICESCMGLQPEEFSKTQDGVEAVIELRYGNDAVCTACDKNNANFKVVEDS